jgi:hypothetical protein
MHPPLRPSGRRDSLPTAMTERTTRAEAGSTCNGRLPRVAGDADPPHFLRRAGVDVAGRERLVLSWVPGSCDGGKSGGEAVGDREAVSGAERAVHHRLRPLGDGALPLVVRATRALPPDALARVRRHVFGRERAIARGVPARSLLRKQIAKRSPGSESFARAERTAMSLVPLDDLGPPNVAPVARAAPPDAPTGVGGSVFGRELSVSALVPLPGQPWIDGREAVGFRDRATDAERAVARADHPRDHGGLPAVIGGPRAGPPDHAVRFGGYVSRGERGVARVVPELGRLGRERRERVRDRHAVAGAERTAVLASVIGTRLPAMIATTATSPPQQERGSVPHLGGHDGRVPLRVELRDEARVVGDGSVAAEIGVANGTRGPRSHRGGCLKELQFCHRQMLTDFDTAHVSRGIRTSTAVTP